MKVYIDYLVYLMRHKWFVFVECCKLGIPWLGVIHDWSKFSLTEFPRSARRYCGEATEKVKDDYKLSWLHHQHHNKHHWIYWVVYIPLPSEPYNESIGCLPMPRRYMREMLADWIGSGRTFSKPDTKAWYESQGNKMFLHPATRAWIEGQLYQ
jgi:hypothetical protein